MLGLVPGAPTGAPAPSSKALTISTLVYTPVRRLSGAPPVPEAPGGAIVLVPLFLGPFVVPFNC